MAAHTSLQQSTDSGTAAADHAEQIANMQFQIMELQLQLDDLGIDLGSKQTLIDSMLSQTFKLAPDKQIAHLSRLITTMQNLVTKYDDNISQNDGTDAAARTRKRPRQRANQESVDGLLVEHDHESDGTGPPSPARASRRAPRMEQKLSLIHI